MSSISLNYKMLLANAALTSRISYWIPYLAWPIIGALLVYIYIVTKIEVNALFAFQTGLAAPLILKSLSNVIPKHPIDPGAGA
jgi:uncharacterized membrane protein YhaH (DUF805 family)